MRYHNITKDDMQMCIRDRLEDVFEAGIDCSSKTMYPDWLSLTGKGYISSMYKQYGKISSPMGCRAFLSPWYERGGMYPADSKDVPVFVGRFNIGVVSLHLPMIDVYKRQGSWRRRGRFPMIRSANTAFR